MRANTAFLAVVALVGGALLVTLWGCGYGPISQSYAIQSGAQPVSVAIGEETEVPALMKKLRTETLNLDDKLLSGDKNQITSAAIRVSQFAEQVSKFQPAIKRAPEDAQIFKRLAMEVNDYAIEVAKAADAGQLAYANDIFLQMRQRCSQCHQYFRGVAPTSDNLDIPEVEIPAPIPDPAVDAGNLLPDSGVVEPPAPLLP
jgi:hypothetical protein